MSDNILIIGSGGSYKYRYIKTLLEFGANITILDPEGEDWWKDEDLNGIDLVLCSFNNLDEIIEKAKMLHFYKRFNVIDTIFELALEPAAEIRKQLGIKGLSPELVLFGRSKSLMLEFMKKNNIRTAPSRVFSNNYADKELESIIAWASQIGDRTWILRPDRAGGKIGVFKFDGIRNLPHILTEARRSMINHPYLPVVYYNMFDKWVLSQYIHGHEIEAEVLVDKGKIVFLGMLLKTVNIENKHGIEENRYIMPAEGLLSYDLFEDLRKQCTILANEISQKIMSKIDREQFVLHPEFRVTSDGQAYMLEYAFRNGGGLNPKQILYSHGIDVFKFSALATLNKRGDYIKKKLIKGASGYQMIFSNRCGKYHGTEGIKKANNLSIIPGLPIGTQIKCPHIEVLEYVMATDFTPWRVDMMLDEALRNAEVVIGGERIPVPLSEYKSYWKKCR